MERLDLETVKPGDTVTVIKGPTRTCGGGLFGSSPVTDEDRRWNGALLRVTAVDLPFIVVVPMERNRYCDKPNPPEKIDCREYHIASVSAEYVAALAPSTTTEPQE